MSYQSYIDASNIIKKYYKKYFVLKYIKKINITQSYHLFNLTNDLWLDNNTLLNNVINNITWEQIYYITFLKCIKCNCCERHTVNKPNKIMKWIEIPRQHYFQDFNTICNCSCRHLARRICRNID